VPGNEVRAIAAGRQAVASGNVRSRVYWGEVVRCGSASGPERRRAQRGRYLGAIPNGEMAENEEVVEIETGSNDTTQNQT
jgi:hypothetical protein